jgi:hypothetical protein
MDHPGLKENSKHTILSPANAIIDMESPMAEQEH